jgi:hypothetical protein
MAYNAPTSRVLAFSGQSATTWAWDGTTWTKLNPTNQPAARTGQSVAIGPTGHVVMFGGDDVTSGMLYNDLWQWKSGTWNQVSASGPAARDSFGMSYDATRDQTLIFGGLP